MSHINIEEGLNMSNMNLNHSNLNISKINPMEDNSRYFTGHEYNRPELNGSMNVNHEVLNDGDKFNN